MSVSAPFALNFRQSLQAMQDLCEHHNQNIQTFIHSYCEGNAMNLLSLDPISDPIKALIREFYIYQRRVMEATLIFNEYDNAVETDLKNTNAWEEFASELKRTQLRFHYHEFLLRHLTSVLNNLEEYQNKKIEFTPFNNIQVLDLFSEDDDFCHQTACLDDADTDEEVEESEEPYDEGAFTALCFSIERDVSNRHIDDRNDTSPRSKVYSPN